MNDNNENTPPAPAPVAFGLPVWNGIGQPGSVMPITTTLAADLEDAQARLWVICDGLKIPRESASAEIARRYEAGKGTVQRNDKTTIIKELTKDIRTGSWPTTPPAERPTPITDALSDKYAGDPSCVDYRDELEKTCFDLERQLAEAREELADWKDAAASAENPNPDEIHCACVPLLRGALAKARKQRDRLAEALDEIRALPTCQGCDPDLLTAVMIATNAMKGNTNESR